MSKLIPLDQALAQREHEAAEQQQRASRRKTSTFAPIEAPQLHGRAVPDRRWLVHGWIPDRAVTLLGGDGGTGKSLLALQLVAATALGKPWLGMPVPRRRSLALFCEDDGDEVHARAAAVARGYDADLADLEGAFWDPRSGKENVLMSFGERDMAGKVAPLFGQVRSFVRDHGVQLLVIDTLADTFAGNENFRAQARAFVNLLGSLAVEMDGAVVLTAHPSVAGKESGSGLSGSTAWNNSVRSRLYLTRPAAAAGEVADPNERLLKRVKSNYSGINDELRLRWDAGMFTSLAEPSGIDRIALGAKADRVFLELLRTTYDAAMWVSPRSTSNNYAPTVFAKHPAREGLGKPAFENALHRLLQAGRVRPEQYGRPADPRTRLCLA